MIAIAKLRFNRVLLAGLAIAVLTNGCGRKSELEPEDSELTQMEDLFAPQRETVQQPITADTVVARVNEREIVFAELQEQIRDLLRRAGANISPEEIRRESAGILESVLDNLIMTHLIEMAVLEEGVEVEEGEIVIRLRQIASQVPEGRRLSEILEESGIAMDDFREGIRKELAAQKLIDKQTAAVPESQDDEVAQFYQENQEAFAVPETAEASHIFVAFKPEDQAQDRSDRLSFIRRLQLSIRDGDAVFEDIAREHSDAPSSQEAGRLGTIYRGQMLPNIDEAVFTQELGVVGPPIETTYGYHIIRVDERKPARTLPLDEASEDIRNHLNTAKRQDAINSFIEKLYSQAEIEILRDPRTIRLDL